MIDSPWQARKTQEWLKNCSLPWGSSVSVEGRSLCALEVTEIMNEIFL
jgi:hypothetical protein